MFLSFRARVVATVIALVATTAGVVAAVAFVLVRDSLRDQLVEDAVARSDFNIGVLATEEQLPRDADRAAFEASGLADRFLLRGAGGIYVEFAAGTEAFASSLALLEADELVSADTRAIVARGEFGYEFLTLDGTPTLVVAGRRPPTGPDFYFFFSAESVEDTLGQVQRVLFIAGAAVLVLGALGAGLIARRVLRPVAIAGEAAEAMADGDLTVRLPGGSRDEFGRWALAFNRMAASLEEQIAALVAAQEREKRFVADVSHELRTPLTALVNEAGILQRHLASLPEPDRQVAELLVSDVARMRRLVEDLLEISRLEAAGDGGDGSYVDLERFLGAVIADRHPAASLRMSGADEPVPVDRRALERIVGNLLDNARSHAPNASVLVTATVSTDDVRIAVADHGPGVPEEDLPRLFDRFYKGGDPGRGGSGLGLAIARQHARRLGGDLTVSSGQAGGLVFDLLLPVTEPLRGGDTPDTSPPQPDAANTGHQAGRTP